MIDTPTKAGPDTICACGHWWEEHQDTGGACFAPSCECNGFTFSAIETTPDAIADRGGDPDKWPEWVKAAFTRDRLEYLRSQINAERISMSELSELQGLAEHIDPSDVQLLEWAGVPEFPPTCDICDEPMVCDRGEACTVHAGDWNGETGNHLSCEREQAGQEKAIATALSGELGWA